MKVVLVIDMPEEYRTEDVLVDYCLHTKGEYKVIRKSGNHPLKPLPEKKTYSEAEFWGNSMQGDIREMEGWNKCLKAITGETE